MKRSCSIGVYDADNGINLSNMTIKSARSFGFLANVTGVIFTVPLKSHY